MPSNTTHPRYDRSMWALTVATCTPTIVAILGAVWRINTWTLAAQVAITSAVVFVAGAIIAGLVIKPPREQHHPDEDPPYVIECNG